MDARTDPETTCELLVLRTAIPCVVYSEAAGRLQPGTRLVPGPAPASLLLVGPGHDTIGSSNMSAFDQWQAQDSSTTAAASSSRVGNVVPFVPTTKPAIRTLLASLQALLAAGRLRLLLAAEGVAVGGHTPAAASSSRQHSGAAAAAADGASGCAETAHQQPSTAAALLDSPVCPAADADGMLQAAHGTAPAGAATAAAADAGGGGSTSKRRSAAVAAPATSSSKRRRSDGRQWVAAGEQAIVTLPFELQLLPGFIQQHANSQQAAEAAADDEGPGFAAAALHAESSGQQPLDGQKVPNSVGLELATYTVMQWLMSQGRVQLVNRHITAAFDPAAAAAAAGSDTKEKIPRLHHSQSTRAAPVGAAGRTGATSVAASGSASCQLPSTQQLLHHFGAPNRDVRDLLFQLAEPRGWPWEAADPTGLRCQLFRYQRRALCWMLWRELGPPECLTGLTSALTGSAEGKTTLDGCFASQQECEGHAGHGGQQQAKKRSNQLQQPMPGSQAEAQRGPQAAAAAATAATSSLSGSVAAALAPVQPGVMGLDLLNPLWECVEFSSGGGSAPTAAAAANSGSGSYCNGSVEPASSNQQQQDSKHGPGGSSSSSSGMLAYYSPQVGEVTHQVPPGCDWCRGGILAEEMGLGKTVEVLALVLAHPPPPASPAPAAAAANPLKPPAAAPEAAPEALGQQQTGASSSNKATAAPPAPAATQGAEQQPDHSREQLPANPPIDRDTSSSSSSSGWPSPGRQAGPTLVVMPPAILQQWVQEVGRHTGLKVVVYEGLAWHRRQTEQEERKRGIGSLSRKARKERKMQEMMAQWSYALNGPPDTPVFDSEAEAAAAVAQLLTAEVVLTTYPVLQQEVHFSGAAAAGSSSVVQSLRHSKRYKVPESPLLQLHWWRLVLDEAQMVGGGLSNVAVMADRLNAWHRWVVTGTPIGPHGLADLQGLLRLIKAEPFRDDKAFHTAIQWPCLEAEAAVAKAQKLQGQLDAARQHQQQQQGTVPVQPPAEMGGSPDPATATATATATAIAAAGVPDLAQLEAATAAAWQQAEVRSRDAGRRLAALSKPLMWRMTKATSAKDHPLPPRQLSVARLKLGVAEQSFYDHILDKTAAARQALLAPATGDGEQQQQAGGQQPAQQQPLPPQQQPGGAPGQQDAESAAGSTAEPAAAASEPAHPPQAPHHRSHRGRPRAGDTKEALEALAARELHQLRLACVHPQLTAYWRELSAELQLRQGGALGIGEILGRMRSSSQLKLQQQERELCCHLNALACQLLAAAVAQEEAGGSLPSISSSSKKGRKRKRAAAGADTGAPAGAAADPPEPGAAAAAEEGQAAATGAAVGGSSQAKRVRFADADADKDSPAPPGGGAAAGELPPSPTHSRAETSNHAAAAAGASGEAALPAADADDGPPAEQATPEQLRAQALQLLEESFKIGEDGIEAAGSEEALELNIQGADATIKAWRYMQLHTCTALSELYQQLGRRIEAENMQLQAASKRRDLLERTQLALEKAQEKLNAHRVSLAAAEQDSAAGCEVAAAGGMLYGPASGVVPAGPWLQQLTQQLADTKAAAAAEREADQLAAAAAAGEGHEGGPGGNSSNSSGGTVVLLGKQVMGLLSALEDQAMALRTVVRGLVAVHHSQLLQQRLDWALQGLDADSVVRQQMVAQAATKHHPSNHHLQQQQQAQGPVLQQQQQHRQVSPQERVLAASYQFLDCMPDRRLLWRLLFQGRCCNSCPPGSNPCCACCATATSHLPGTSIGDPTLCSSSSTAAAASCGFAMHTWAAQAAGAAAGAANVLMGPGAAQPMADRLLRRQVLKEVRSRGTLLLKAAKSVLSAPPSVAATFQTAVAAAGVGEVTPALYQLLQQLPLPALSAAADDAAARVQVVRLQRETYIAELNVEVAQSELDAACVEAAAAAAGQLPSVVTLVSEKKEDQLNSRVRQLKQQCKELAAKTRFLQHQAQESIKTAEAAARALAAGVAGAAAECAEAGAAGGAASDNRAASQQQQQQQQQQLERPTCSTVAAGDATGLASPSAVAAAAAAAQGHATAAAVSAAGPASAADGPEDAPECPVCRCVLEGEIQVFPCGHWFCTDCANHTLASADAACPYCRAKVTVAGSFRVALASAGGGAAGGAATEVDPPEGPELLQMQVTGEWMTKLSGLLRRLLLLRKRAPQQKALVFSQFPDALQLLGKALDVARIRHVSLTGGPAGMRRAVRDFNENPEVMVFLLSLRAGAAGLTLTRANHVFLLEPALDPAIEQQAVARVHRIGQEQPVTVTRLLIVGSVEEQVLAVAQARQRLLHDERRAQRAQHTQHGPQQQQQQHSWAAAQEAVHLQGVAKPVGAYAAGGGPEVLQHQQHQQQLLAVEGAAAAGMQLDAGEATVLDPVGEDDPGSGQEEDDSWDSGAEDLYMPEDTAAAVAGAPLGAAGAGGGSSSRSQQPAVWGSSSASSSRPGPGRGRLEAAAGGGGGAALAGDGAAGLLEQLLQRRQALLN